MNWAVAHAGNLIWFGMIAALVGWFAVTVVRAAKARSRRLFVDLPNKRIGPRRESANVIDHRWDAM